MKTVRTKAVGYGLWAVGSEARYVRILSSRSFVVTAKKFGHEQIVPLWKTEKTLRLILATAYSLQPTAWRSSR
jgi:hypothetical protein